MNKRFAFLPLVVLITAVLSCNLSSEVATLDPAQISTFSAQTVAAIQQQTQPVQPGDTAQPPADAPTFTLQPPTLTLTNTLMPSVTPQPTFTPTITATPKPCNQAIAIDVNVPDNWETTTLDHFIKTWRFTNLGTCTWTSGYTLVFDHGDRMGALDSVQVTLGTIPPGGTVDVSVNLLSPAAVGTYQGYFKLRAPEGTLFGTVWVKIKVYEITLPPPAIAPMTNRADGQVELSPGDIKSALATCPAGTVVTGGGFATNSAIWVYTQYKDGNGWRVYGKSNAAGNQTLFAYAVCLTYPSAVTTQVHASETIPAGALGHPIVACPAGSVVTGGGYAGIANGDVPIHNSSKTGNGWQMYGVNHSGLSKTVNVYAICLSGTGATTDQYTKNMTIDAHNWKGDYVECPAGRVMTGGGWAREMVDLINYNSSFADGRWYGFATNSGGSSRSMGIYGICMAIP